MRIGELSRRSGVSARSLRYYEQHGLLAARRGSNSYREYDDDAVHRAETIRMLFGMGFPRDVVRSVLRCTGDGNDASHDILAEQLEQVRVDLAQQIESLTDTHEQVSTFLANRRRQADAV